MKRPLVLLALTIIVIFNSCGEKQDVEKVAESYGLIYSSFVFSKDAQQKFIDKAAEVLNSVKYKEDAIIDTKELTTLLDSAKFANQSRLPIINATIEIDEEIKYKTKVVKYVSLLDAIYNNQFIEFIKILDSNSDNRFERSSKLLLQPLKELDEAGEACSEAGKKIRSKYDIQVIDYPS